MDTDSFFTDPPSSHYSLKIDVDPPYLKTPELPKNDLGLPEKPYYTTGDLCSVLEILPDTFRQRIYRGHYPETDRLGDKRRFTYDQAKHILQTTETLVQKGVLLDRKGTKSN